MRYFFFGVWCTLEHALMLGETVRLANLSLKKDEKQKQERIKKSFILADVCGWGESETQSSSAGRKY